MGTYTIVKADPAADKEDVLPILKRNLKDISEQRYEWNYINSHCGYAHCWLATEENSGKFVGSGALFPRRIYINGKIVYGAIAGDFAVDKEHRAYGPALKLQKIIQKSFTDNNIFEFIYGIPNKAATALFLRIGYKELNHYNMFVKPLKAEYKSKKYLPPATFTKSISKIIDFCLKVFSKENRYKKSSDFSFEIKDTFDERFDVFWTKVSRQFHIICERSSQFLNWRYKQSPYKNYKIFSLVNNDREIIGYIVYYIKENMCYIADILFINSDEIIDSLFAEFCFYMRQINVGSISIYYLGEKLLLKKLKEFNFFLYEKAENKVLIYFDKTSPFANVLLNSENWHFLEGDSDL